MHPLAIPGTGLVLMSALAGALVSAPPEPVDTVGEWLNDRVMRAAETDDVHGPKEGVYRLIPLAELDAPEAVKQYLREQIQRSRAGVVRVPKGTIPSQRELMMALAKARRFDAALRQRLPNPPSDLGRSLLGVADMIGMVPAGAMQGGNSSGLSRFYELSGIGIVEFNEENFRVPGSVIEAFVEAQNAVIDGTPAQIETTVDDQGRGRVSLIWAGKDKVYRLSATGDDNVERKAEVLRSIAATVKD